MSTSTLVRIRIAASSCLVVLVAACGGGGGVVTVGPSDVAPVVTLQPADASVAAPSTAVFTAAASGTPAPTVQWQRSNDLGATWTPIAGAASSSYTTPASAAGDDGALFRAVFSNEAGTATTNAGRLTVTSTTHAPGLSLLAGDIGGPGNIDGTGTAARLLAPWALTADTSGNLYLGDSQASNIRKITPAGVVTTLAGPTTIEGSLPYGDVDGTGTDARFNSPAGLAVDGAGNIFVGDFGNGRIRKVTPGGVVTTFAGGGTSNTVFDGVGTAAVFRAPIGIAFDSHGNLFVCDQNLHSVRKITPDGTVSTFAGVSNLGIGSIVDGTGAGARFIAPQSLAIDANDNLYVGDGSVLRKITPQAVVTTVPGTSDISYPHGLAFDADGDLFVADRNSNVIRKITPAGAMTTFAGTVRTQFIPGYADGTGSAAVFYYPSGIAIDPNGNVYVAEEGNALIRKITPAAVVTTVVGAAALSGSADGTGAAARFTSPRGVAVDPSGDVVVVDSGSSAIRRVTQAGVATTLAGGTMGSADGAPAAAQFQQPWGAAYDHAGNLFVTDTGNATIRKIAPDGTVSTYAGTAGAGGSLDGSGTAARFSQPTGVATDAAGNVYVADTQSNVIRKITPDRAVTTLAGQAGVAGSADGAAASATFNGPYGVAVDASGNVLVADTQNHTIRRIAPDGTVSTLAGSASVEGSSDGTGAAAAFRAPNGITTDASGNAYVIDVSTWTLRKITPAGVVTTLVGVPGEIGVRLGTDPRLASSWGVAWLPGGQLAITSADAVLLYTLP